MPSVSVIVPNYNHAPYLKERLDSILNQTFQDFELIIMDDCSADNSREVISAYAGNAHVSHVILNEQNTGNTFLQWERGIRLAKGKYVWIAESDDVALPALLEALVGELQGNPRAVVAYCHSQMIDSQSRPMALTWHKHGSSGKTEVYDGYWYLRHKMLIHNHIYNASMTVFLRSAFDNVPDTYQHYRYCGDWLFWSHICSQGQVIEVCRQLNQYRQHERKVTMDSQHYGRKWRDIGGIMREFVAMLQLSPLQQRCLRGRWTKRLLKEGRAYASAFRQEYPSIYGGTWLDICLYEAGKLTGFLK